MIGTVARGDRWKWLYLVLLAVLFSPVLAGESQQPGESWKPATRQWIETVALGKQLKLVNPYGDVHVRFGGYENKVEIVATIQRLEESLPELTVTFRRDEAGLEAIVGPQPPSAPAAPAPSGTLKTRDRMDLAVFVPKGVALHARTEAGRMDIKGLQSDLDAESVKGEIRIVKVKGRVQARSERGDISATLETGATGESQEFSTRTGDISIHLWEDANLTARIATSGEISTDFSMQVERNRFEEPGKHAVAVIGKGGPELSLASKRGNIHLLWLPRHFKRGEAEDPAEKAPSK